MAADDESHLLAVEVSGWVWTWIEAVNVSLHRLGVFEANPHRDSPSAYTGPGTDRRKDGGKAVGSGRPLGMRILSA